MDLTLDHKALEGAHETRRYFNKFERIIGHLNKVAEMTAADGLVLPEEVPILHAYLNALANTFTALSYKYLMAGRVSSQLPSLLSIDQQDSGFPVYQELLQMANDAMQADKHLKSRPTLDTLKKDMIRHILNEHSTPVRLQFAASQGLYYQHLSNKALFWAQNDPQAIWQGNVTRDRRRYLLHWASYDSQQNIPTIYLMDLEDTGKTALPRDESRWPRAQSHLMAQAVNSLKMLTIATGFDRDFDDLHPKRLRRFHIGPMYSHTFTEQTGPLRDVLAEASSSTPGTDWALAWTMETLVSERVETERSGFFGSVEREIYQLDPFLSADQDGNGLTEQHRSLILPQKPFQVLEELDPPGFSKVRKYVVGPSGKIISYR
ncbi:MAG: hypothetical protein JKY49_17805 [Cohaesibacteraceae bacterium]|nr:hypothetical protein [Cohaesibacteraceae bacterium]